jgi:hypothetical protein
VSQEGWRRKGQERLNWSSHGPRDAESKKTVVLCYCLVF